MLNNRKENEINANHTIPRIRFIRFHKQIADVIRLQHVIRSKKWINNWTELIRVPIHHLPTTSSTSSSTTRRMTSFVVRAIVEPRVGSPISREALSMPSIIPLNTAAWGNGFDSFWRKFAHISPPFAPAENETETQAKNAMLIVSADGIRIDVGPWIRDGTVSVSLMPNATAVWKMVFAPCGSYVGITYGFSRSFTNEETGKNERTAFKHRSD